MDLEDFLKTVPAEELAKTRHRTLELWWRIYTYIETEGFADMVDDYDFAQWIKQYTDISTPAVMSNLRRMAACGLVKKHRLILKSSPRDFVSRLFDPMMGEPATHMVRYTLPGVEVPLRSKSSEAARDQAAKDKAGLQRRIAEGPEDVRTLHDVEDLRTWFEERRRNGGVLTAEQNERLRPLVEKAGALLRAEDTRLQKLYIVVALQSKLDPGL